MDKLKKKNGVAMIIFIILLPLMLGFMGIAIDCGNLMLNNFKLRASCRLAALTGGSCSLLANSGYEITDTNKAEQLAKQNFWLNMSGKADARVDDVNLSIHATKKNIRVEASMKVEFYFMPVLGAAKGTTIHEYYDVYVN